MIAGTGYRENAGRDLARLPRAGACRNGRLSGRAEIGDGNEAARLQSERNRPEGMKRKATDWKGNEEAGPEWQMAGDGSGGYKKGAVIAEG